MIPFRFPQFSTDKMTEPIAALIGLIVVLAVVCVLMEWE